MKIKTQLSVFIFLLCLIFQTVQASPEINKDNIQAVEATQESKHPDYSQIFNGDDKYEKFNRKMYNLNTKLNKYIAKPIHILWSSIMPKYGIDRLRDAYNNIEYPKRLASCIIQRDGQAAKAETLRFLTNSTIGIGGLFDPADRIFKIKPTNENMEQALGKCKMKQGSYLVVPCLNACTPRSLCGRALEAALDPVVYLASPVTSLIKFGLMLNRTSYMQPFAQMLESNFADPYDIQKKLFGMENYIKNENLNRLDLLSNTDTTGAAADINTPKDILPLAEIYPDLVPDIILEGYEKQTPIVDGMKTALFEHPDLHKSIWNDLSVWNRSFAKRIKSETIEVTPNRKEYTFRYILQKDKNSPIAVLYPSVGEGVTSHHSEVFAKMFYEQGYSVLIIGSHFNWEFVKSLPEGYYPGIPQNDSYYAAYITKKALEKLESKYNCTFSDKVLVGTSFGAYMTLFVADRENKNNTLNISKFIAISPPIELAYAMEQIDRISKINNENFKQKTAITAAKVLQITEQKNCTKEFCPDKLPFSEEEGKIITALLLRQKLSDLIYTAENDSKQDKKDLYNKINNLDYKDYAEIYLGIDDLNKLKYAASLYSISEYLQNSNNYKIYESFDDYFITKEQITKLKNIAGDRLKCINCGSHLGFLYRNEFKYDLLQELDKKLLITKNETCEQMSK